MPRRNGKRLDARPEFGACRYLEQVLHGEWNAVNARYRTTEVRQPHHQPERKHHAH